MRAHLHSTLATLDSPSLQTQPGRSESTLNSPYSSVSPPASNPPFFLLPLLLLLFKFVCASRRAPTCVRTAVAVVAGVEVAVDVAVAVVVVPVAEVVVEGEQ